MILLWLVMSGIGTLLEFSNFMMYAADIKLELKDLIKDPFTIILSFYFIVNIVQKVGK